MAKYREILKNKNFLFLWIGQIISQFGDRLGQMALIGFIHERFPGSTYELAKIISFTVIPVFLVGPIAGVYVDRWERRTTMFNSDFIRTFLVLLIPLFLYQAKNLIPLYILIFLMFSVGRFFIPAKFAIIPDLVQKEELVLANSLVNITGMIAAILGFGIGGILVDRFGSKSGFYLDSLSFGISALLIFFIRIKQASLFKREKLIEIGRKIVQVEKSILMEIKEGWQYLISEKNVRFSLIVFFVLSAALGSVYVVSIVFVQEKLGSITRDLGILIMFLGIGLFVGSLIYGRFGHKFKQDRAILISLLINGIIITCFALAIKIFASFALASLLVFILGLFSSPIVIGCNTIVHQFSQNNMWGKVFSSVEIIMHIAFLLCMFLSGILAEYISQSSILIGVGIFLIVFGGFSLIFKRHDSYYRA